jgi:hypothetical protein
MLNDLKLSNTLELTSLGGVPVPNLAETIKGNGVDLVVIMTHVTVPSLKGCIGLEAGLALKEGDPLAPDCFERWAEGNLKQADPFEHLWHVGQYVACVAPEVDQVLVVFDHEDQLMHPVACRVEGTWRKSIMMWQNAVNIGFLNGIPDLPSPASPESIPRTA